MGERSQDRRERDFEAVVESVYTPLLRYLRRRADASTADDVLGDVLLVLWRRADDIPAEATLAWCYGVARKCLANHLRGADRQHRLVHRIEAASVPGAAVSDDPDLDEALAALTVKDMEVLRLWAWEELTPREIARALDTTPNAVSIRLHYAKKRLKAELLARKSGPPPGHLGDRQGTEAPR